MIQISETKAVTQNARQDFARSDDVAEFIAARNRWNVFLPLLSASPRDFLFFTTQNLSANRLTPCIAAHFEDEKIVMRGL